MDFERIEIKLKYNFIQVLWQTVLLKSEKRQARVWHWTVSDKIQCFI